MNNNTIENYVEKVVQLLAIAGIRNGNELKKDILREWDERIIDYDKQSYDSNYQDEINSLVESILKWEKYNNIESYILLLLRLLQMNNCIKQDDNNEEFARIFEDTKKDIFNNLWKDDAYVANIDFFIEDFLKKNYNIADANISNQLFINKWLEKHTKTI